MLGDSFCNLDSVCDSHDIVQIRDLSILSFEVLTGIFDAAVFAPSCSVGVALVESSIVTLLFSSILDFFASGSSHSVLSMAFFLSNCALLISFSFALNSSIILSHPVIFPRTLLRCSSQDALCVAESLSPLCVVFSILSNFSSASFSIFFNLVT